jgi:hypothetical protein
MLCRLSQPVSRREPPAGSERLADASEFPVSVLQEAQQEATEQASAQAPIGSPGADVNVLPDGTSGGDDESDRN